jgi:ribonuclease J
MFPRDEMPGIDYIIPDFSYIRKNRDRVKGIILTHGHEDHIGAIAFLLQEIKAPIFATKLTIGLVQSSLRRSLLNMIRNLLKLFRDRWKRSDLSPLNSYV